MYISDILNKKPLANPEKIITCSDGDLVSAAIARMRKHNIGVVVILSNQHVAGIFTERDVVKGLSERGSEFLEMPLAEVMTWNVIVVKSTQTVDDALTLMLDHQFRHLPVVDGDMLVGVLSMRDLAMQKLDFVEQTVEFLKNQVHIGSHPLPM